MRIRRIIVLFGFTPLPLLIIGFIWVGGINGASDAMVRAGSISLYPGGTGKVPIEVINIPENGGLGAYDINVSFNPSVIQVLDVTGGSSPFNGISAKNINNDAGWVRFGHFITAVKGPTGNITVAYLNVKAVGEAGSSTSLGVDVISLVDASTGDEIPRSAISGSVTIVSAAAKEYTLADFPAPFIMDGVINVSIVIGASDPRGPVNPASTIDVLAAISVAHVLGTVTTSGSPALYMDWQICHYNSTNVLEIYRAGNIITFGGLGVNLVMWRYHYLTYHGIQSLPVYMAADAQGPYIYSPSSHNIYRMQNDYGKGLKVTDYAMITLHRDTNDNRYVLIIAGLSGYSTKYGAMWLSNFPEMHGKAIILKMIDNEGDGYIDTISIAEEID